MTWDAVSLRNGHFFRELGAGCTQHARSLVASYGPGATCSVTVSRMARAGPGEASDINLWRTAAFTSSPHLAPLNPSPQLGASVRLLSLQEAPDLGLSPELPFPRQVLVLQRKDSPAQRVRGRGPGRRREPGPPVPSLPPSRRAPLSLIIVLATVGTNYLPVCRQGDAFWDTHLAGVTIAVLLLLRTRNFSPSPPPETCSSWISLPRPKSTGT